MTCFLKPGLFLNESRLLEGVQGLLGSIRSTLSSEPKLVSVTTPSFGCSRGYHLTSDSEGCGEFAVVWFLFIPVGVRPVARSDSDLVSLLLCSQSFVPRGVSPGKGCVFCVPREPIRMKRGGTSATGVPEAPHLLERQRSINVSRCSFSEEKHSELQSEKNTSPSQFSTTATLLWSYQ